MLREKSQSQKLHTIQFHIYNILDKIIEVENVAVVFMC